MPKIKKIIAGVFPPVVLLVIGGFLLGLESAQSVLGWIAVIMGSIGFFSSLWAMWD